MDLKHTSDPEAQGSFHSLSTVTSVITPHALATSGPGSPSRCLHSPVPSSYTPVLSSSLLPMDSSKVTHCGTVRAHDLSPQCPYSFPQCASVKRLFNPSHHLCFIGQTLGMHSPEYHSHLAWSPGPFRGALSESFLSLTHPHTLRRPLSQARRPGLVA